MEYWNSLCLQKTAADRKVDSICQIFHQHMPRTFDVFFLIFQNQSILDQACCDAKLRNLCLAVWSLPRKFVEAGEFLNWLIPFLKFGGLQKLIVWRARQSFTRNTKHLLRLLKTMKDNLIKFCWNPRLKSPSAAHQLAPTGPRVAPLIDEHIFQFS